MGEDLNFRDMRKNPSISVVMPVYNCEKYLREAIESILNQTYKDFEFIIINDGSTDKSPEILQEYAKKDSRIKIINQPNSGIVVALNRGLREAKGEWVFRMDADDIALPDRFECQIDMIKRKPSTVLLGGWCQQIDSQGIPLKINKYPRAHNDLVKCLENLKPFFPHPTACFPRKSVIEIGGYRERFRHSEDTDLWLRLSEIGEIACIHKVVLKLRKHPDNISNLVSGKLQQIKSIAARICYYYRKSGLPDPSVMDDNLWNIFLENLERSLEKSGYFEMLNGWRNLRVRWLSSQNMLKKILGIIYELVVDANARRYVFNRFIKENIVIQMMDETKLTANAPALKNQN